MFNFYNAMACILYVGSRIMKSGLYAEILRGGVGEGQTLERGTQLQAASGGKHWMTNV